MENVSYFLLKTENVEEHKVQTLNCWWNQWDLSCGDHKCLYRISWKSTLRTRKLTSWQTDTGSRKAPLSGFVTLALEASMWSPCLGKRGWIGSSAGQHQEVGWHRGASLQSPGGRPCWRWKTGWRYLSDSGRLEWRWSRTGRKEGQTRTWRMCLFHSIS